MEAEVAQLSAAQSAKAAPFLPYLSGERTPHNDVHAGGTFIGLRSEHDAAVLAYAVMEGVAFGLKDGWQAMQGKLDSPKSALALVGGGARSDTWARLIASSLGRTLMRDDAASAAAAFGRRTPGLAGGRGRRSRRVPPAGSQATRAN